MIMKLCQLLNFRTSVSTDLSSFSAKALASEIQPGDQSPGCVSEASALAHKNLMAHNSTPTISYVLLLHCRRLSLSFSLLCYSMASYVPESLRDCVLHSIAKPGKDPCDSDSYRPIALAPT